MDDDKKIFEYLKNPWIEIRRELSRRLERDLTLRVSVGEMTEILEGKRNFIFTKEKIPEKVNFITLVKVYSTHEVSADVHDFEVKGIMTADDERGISPIYTMIVLGEEV